MKATPERIEELLAEKTIDDGGCLIWTGRLSCSCGHPKHGTMLMRRAVWEARNGPLTPKELISTSCGNRLCLEHLEKVTRAEVSRRANADPRMKAAKRVKSAAWARANSKKLDMEKANAIRASADNDHTLAALYGVDHSMISKVRRNQAWVESFSSPFAGLGAR